MSTYIVGAPQVVHIPGSLDVTQILYTGGISGSSDLLKQWVASEAYLATSITRDSDSVVTTATVEWPDGSAGTYTRTTKNSTWLAVDAFTITHTDSGKTVTQAAVTRDSNGSITVRPALSVA